MSLGVCCHWLEEKISKNGNKSYVNAMNEKTLQLGAYRNGKYSEDRLRSTYTINVKNLARMIPKIWDNGISTFRISSSLFPLADLVPPDYWNNNEITSELKQIGGFIKSRGMRVTTHPGQFCVLSSDTQRVVNNAIVELQQHAWMFDSMGLDNSPYYAINVHGGKRGNSQKLIDVTNDLPQNVKSRLTFENCESSYSPVDLINVHLKTGIPVVWDSHHHVFNDGGMSMSEAITSTQLTWKTSGVKPLQHISNTEPELMSGSFRDRRKHSMYIHYIPDEQLAVIANNSVDVEVEAKAKNLAVFKMMKDFNIKGTHAK